MTPDTRCLGLLPTLDGEQRCFRRDTCQRYTERHTGGPVSQWLCPTQTEFYGAYVPTDAAAVSAEAT